MFVSVCVCVRERERVMTSNSFWEWRSADLEERGDFPFPVVFGVWGWFLMPKGIWDLFVV